MHGNGIGHRLMFLFHTHSYNLNDMPLVIYVVEMSAALWCFANIEGYRALCKQARMVLLREYWGELDHHSFALLDRSCLDK